MTTKLIWLGSPAATPDGWPREDHEESNGRLAKAKLSSGFYRSADAGPDPEPEPAAPAADPQT